MIPVSRDVFRRDVETATGWLIVTSDLHGIRVSHGAGDPAREHTLSPDQAHQLAGALDDAGRHQRFVIGGTA